MLEPPSTIMAGRDRARVDAGHRGGPLGSVRRDVGGERVEADGVPRHELAVVEALRDQHVHDPEREGRVGARPQEQHLVGLGRRLGAPHVDGDHVRAAAAGFHQVPRGVRLAREIGSPQHDQVRVGPHVLLGVGLERPGEADAEAAEPPADHGGRPPLAAPEIGEAAQQLRVHADPVVGGEEAVTRPETDRLAPHRPHAADDAVERLVPADLPQRRVPAIAHERLEQTLRVVQDLA
jgi:hypothetical protein